jgi:hypothetical protein
LFDTITKPLPLRKRNFPAELEYLKSNFYFTVTDFARLRGLSGSNPLTIAE